ncbi:Oidioi.mRNA.OKI2018_I69.PAR.g9534.t2.cds [Oikopleura dioica]|uniref:Oidioi.mRNA.OKI2018_I69.PAR.g9534.t2.cds n=1 Tax=Oikopleura dioica TaxID=34765 RepID=A0ABN7RPP3_OIKDI|nr:Oidioi.mRNA.OKI2018_I69.PAR.g9534.t2.cds [Oikopleura dioica]
MSRRSGRRRYVPINDRVMDLCEDFLPEDRVYYNGSNSNLPEDAHKLYDTFNGDDRDFFNSGRAKFFQAAQNPQSVFADLDGNSGEIRECIKVMPDGRRVKERTVTSYEDLDEPIIEAQQSAQQVNAEPPKPMTPMEIMFATQAAMKETLQNALNTNSKCHLTGSSIDRLSHLAGVGPVRNEQNFEDRFEPEEQARDYSSAPSRDVKINVLRG